jgi:hypothetical protein
VFEGDEGEQPANQCVWDRVARGRHTTGFCLLHPKFQRVGGLFVDNQFGPPDDRRCS